MVSWSIFNPYGVCIFIFGIIIKLAVAMGYSVPNLTDTKNYVLANGAALFIAYAVSLFVTKINFLFQGIAMCCFKKS